MFPDIFIAKYQQSPPCDDDQIIASMVKWARRTAGVGKNADDFSAHSTYNLLSGADFHISAEIHNIHVDSTRAAWSPAPGTVHDCTKPVTSLDLGPSEAIKYSSVLVLTHSGLLL